MKNNATIKNICLLCATMLMCTSVTYGQNAINALGTSSPQIGRSEYQRTAGPLKTEGISGVLEVCGSFTRGTVLVLESYEPNDGSATTSTIEVVTHPKGYRFAPHDLFGSLLRTAAYAVKTTRQLDLSAGVAGVQCMEWEFLDKTQGGIVCHSQVTTGRFPEGVVGWFTGNPDDGYVTVRIAYRHPKGLLPGQVIDKFLREHPSEVPKNPMWHHDWETKDIEKWMAHLDENKDDLLILQAGAAYLTRYDRLSFGLLESLQQRDNPDNFSKSRKGVNERMNAWVETRKKAIKADQSGK